MIFPLKGHCWTRKHSWILKSAGLGRFPCHTQRQGNNVSSRGCETGKPLVSTVRVWQKENSVSFTILKRSSRPFPKQEEESCTRRGKYWKVSNMDLHVFIIISLKEFEITKFYKHFSGFLLFRVFLGPNQGPAQWPHCNRYTEATIEKLLQVYPSDRRRKEEQVITKWSLILDAYHNIRKTVLNNHQAMKATEIQLPSLNKKTLQHW